MVFILQSSSLVLSMLQNTLKEKEKTVAMDRV